MSSGLCCILWSNPGTMVGHQPQSFMRSASQNVRSPISMACVPRYMWQNNLPLISKQVKPETIRSPFPGCYKTLPSRLLHPIRCSPKADSVFTMCHSSFFDLLSWAWPATIQVYNKIELFANLKLLCLIPSPPLSIYFLPNTNYEFTPCHGWCANIPSYW